MKAAEDVMAYSPTSPAAEAPGSPAHAPPLELDGGRGAGAPGSGLGSGGGGYDIEDALDPTAIEYADKPGQDGPLSNFTGTELADAVPQSVPELKVGTKLDQVLRLKANRWTMLGKGPKSQLLINADGVSRDHCSLRWDPYKRQVELRDTSAHGTLLNGQRIRNARRNLSHADRVCIEGKGRKYTFVLDLRPVGLGFGDPCTKFHESLPNKAISLRRRRDSLRVQVTRIEEQLALTAASAFDKEKAYYKVIAKIASTRGEIEASEKKLEVYRAEKTALDAALTSSRTEWLERIKRHHSQNEAEAQPLHDKIADVQAKLERLKLMKAEWERKLEPTKYDFIEAGDPQLPAGGMAAQIEEEESSEEELLMGDTPKPTSLEAGADEVGTVEASHASQGPTEDLAALKLELFGDFESSDEEASSDSGDAEPAAKRSKTA